MKSKTFRGYSVGEARRLATTLRREAPTSDWKLLLAYAAGMPLNTES
jgi:hypothetical protein